MRKATLLFTTCIFCLFSIVANAGNLYRYTTTDGVRVTADTLPPSAAELGYEIVSESGRVLTVVAPVDPSAIEDSDSGSTRDDEYLLTSFSSAEEIVRLKQRKLDILRIEMKNLENNLAALYQDEKDLHTEASDIELTGQQVPASFKKRLAAVRKNQLGMQRAIKERKDEYRELQRRYDGYISRFRELKGQSELSDSPASLAEASSEAPLPDQVAPN